MTRAFAQKGRINALDNSVAFRPEGDSPLSDFLGDWKNHHLVRILTLVMTSNAEAEGWTR